MKLGENAGKIQSSSKSISVIAIIVYIAIFISINIFARTFKGCGDACGFIFALIFFLVIGGLYIAEIILYTSAMDAMKELDTDLITYAVEN
jgi:hypothetical protein